jgi:hypothetical protein
MAMGALFIGWGAPVRGREQRALELFAEAMAYYGRLQEAGEIETFEPISLEPHGGDLAGFLLIKGEPAKLAQLRASAEFIAITIRAQLLLEHVGVTGAFHGEGLRAQFEDFGKQLATLT